MWWLPSWPSRSWPRSWQHRAKSHLRKVLWLRPKRQRWRWCSWDDRGEEWCFHQTTSYTHLLFNWRRQLRFVAVVSVVVIVVVFYHIYENHHPHQLIHSSNPCDPHVRFQHTPSFSFVTFTKATELPDVDAEPDVGAAASADRGTVRGTAAPCQAPVKHKGAARANNGSTTRRFAMAQLMCWLVGPNTAAMTMGWKPQAKIETLCEFLPNVQDGISESNTTSSW